MKKILTLAAAAALFAGCDFVGGVDGAPVTIANLTVSDVAAPDGQTAIVDVQDIGGRSYFRAALQPGVSLGSFEIARPEHTLFVTVYGQSASSEQLTFVASTQGFAAGDLAEDTTLDLQTRDGSVVGQAVLDLP